MIHEFGIFCMIEMAVELQGIFGDMIFFLTWHNIMWYFTNTETDEKEEVHLKYVSQRAAGGGIAVDGSRWNGLSRATRTGIGREDGEETSLKNQIYAGIS